MISATGQVHFVISNMPSLAPGKKLKKFLISSWGGSRSWPVGTCENRLPVWPLMSSEGQHRARRDEVENRMRTDAMFSNKCRQEGNMFTSIWLALTWGENMTCHSFLPALCCISFSLTVLAAALSFNTDFYGHSWYSEIQQMYFFSRHQHALSETAGLFRDISSLGLLEGFITQAASALSDVLMSLYQISFYY